MNKIDNIYTLYTKECRQLAASLVIKSSDTALSMNSYLVSRLGNDAVDQYKPETWRYYMHMAGLYHAVDTNMEVVSVDTLENIEFNPENLKYHRATAKYYSPGNRGYLELVDRYPTQELLICGILNPVDIKAAIAAKDFQILSYDTSLVDSNEYTLIQDLNAHIAGHVVRFYNQQYGVSDPLYYAAFISNLVMLLVPAIINLRLERCNTNEAHSFHIRYYLISNGIADKYVDYLSTEQALYLYRNLRYLQLHLGKVETFNELVKVLLQWRAFPLDQFIMQHDLTNLVNDLRPTPIFEREAAYGNVVSSSRQFLPLTEILAKEAKLAPGNIKQQEEYEAEYNFRLRNTQSNHSNTKLLESLVIDRSDSKQYSLEETLINQWLWMVKKNLYRSVISIQNPKTSEFIPLDMRDAFILMLFCYYKAYDLELSVIPDVQASRVQRLPQPTINELVGIVDSQYVSEAELSALLQTMPDTDAIISIEAFRNHTIALHKAAALQYNLTSAVENHRARGFYATAVERLYCDATVKLVATRTSYKDWLTVRNFNMDDMAASDYMALYTTILKEATGANLNSEKTLQSIHKAMIGILKDLSSYTIQLIGDSNIGKIISLDWAAIRLADIYAKFKHRFEQVETVVDINAFTGIQKEAFQDDPGDFIAASVLGATTKHRVYLDPTLDMSLHTLTSGITLYLDSAPLYPSIKTEVDNTWFESMSIAEKMNFVQLFKQ